jgi:uncharacterized membrane protein YcfT
VAWVDHAKGICIVLVVMMHSTLGVEKAAGAESWLHPFIAFAQPFRMPDFFLIAGLFVARAIDRDWRTFLDRKLLHFAYFYALWVVIQWSFKSLGPGLLAGDLTGAGHALLSALWEPPGTLWFIAMLPVFFVLAKLLRPVPAPLVLAVAALMQIAPVPSDNFMVVEFQNRFVFFLIGAYAARHIFRFADLVARHREVALSALLYWACVNGVLVYRGVALDPGIGLLLGLAGALAVVMLSVLLASLDWTAALRHLGSNSLIIYLAFFLPMAASRTAILKFGLIEDLGTASLVVTALAILTPLLLHRLVRSTPLRLLFERPVWARLPPARPAERLVPAE